MRRRRFITHSLAPLRFVQLSDGSIADLAGNQGSGTSSVTDGSSVTVNLDALTMTTAQLRKRRVWHDDWDKDMCSGFDDDEKARRGGAQDTGRGARGLEPPERGHRGVASVHARGAPSSARTAVL